jgi:general secretion pathway protein L
LAILKNVLGLDLGSHTIKAVEFQQNLRGFETVQLRSLPRADEEIPLSALIERFVQLHRLSTDHVVAALPGNRVSSRLLDFPFRDRKRLAQAVPFEIEAAVPFEIDDLVIDWMLVGGDRSHAKVAASLVPRGEVSAVIRTLAEAGCAPRTLEAEGLVLGNLSAVFDLPGTRLLMDLGHRKTTFCLLVDGNAVAARTVPVGGRQLTEAIARDRGLSLPDAERAKCEEGVLRPALGAATPETAAVLDRLGRETARTLGAFEPAIAELSPDPVAGLTLFGGTAQLDRIDEHLAERTGLPAARLGLPIEGRGKGLVAGGPPVLFAPAIALGLRGTAEARTRMNFRQDEFAVRLDLGGFVREFRPTAVLGLVTLLLATLSFGTSTFLESRRATALERESARLYAEAFPDRAAPPSVIAALREEVRSANERADYLGVYHGNLSALDLLAEISKRVPSDLDVVFEELNIDRQTIQLRVYSKSFEAADRLGAELAKFAPFAQTRIGAIETDRKRGGKRFSVTIRLAAEGEPA